VRQAVRNALVPTVSGWNRSGWWWWWVVRSGQPDRQSDRQAQSAQCRVVVVVVVPRICVPARERAPECKTSKNIKKTNKQRRHPCFGHWRLINTVFAGRKHTTTHTIRRFDKCGRESNKNKGVTHIVENGRSVVVSRPTFGVAGLVFAASCCLFCFVVCRSLLHTLSHYCHSQCRMLHFFVPIFVPATANKTKKLHRWRRFSWLEFNSECLKHCM